MAEVVREDVFGWRGPAKRQVRFLDGVKFKIDFALADTGEQRLADIADYGKQLLDKAFADGFHGTDSDVAVHHYEKDGVAMVSLRIAFDVE